jgi:murein DD-endopeptidase MepM/ murein hydrolase activator NlpD
MGRPRKPLRSSGLRGFESHSFRPWGSVTFTHGGHTHVRLGDTVTAGQDLLDTENTGQSGAPHLPFELKLDGLQRCPQRLVQTLYCAGVAFDAVTLPWPVAPEPSGVVRLRGLRPRVRSRRGGGGRQALQPRSRIAHPAFQIFVMWPILSASNRIT